jgi:sodium-coupled neutral amino acid transporter 11
MASIELPTLEKGGEEYQTYVSVSPTANGNNDTNSNSSNISKPHKQSGIAGASANLVNSIVGAGIIGIPYALRESGLLAGLFLLGLVAYLTDKSLRIIVGLASFHPKLKNRDVRTFEDLASYPFGRIGLNFVLVNMFVM